MKKKIFTILEALFIFISGCRSVVVDLPDGKRVYYYSFGMNSEIGTLDIQSSNGATLHLSQLKTDSQAMQIAGQALDIASKLKP